MKTMPTLNCFLFLMCFRFVYFVQVVIKNKYENCVSILSLSKIFFFNFSQILYNTTLNRQFVNIYTYLAKVNISIALQIEVSFLNCFSNFCRDIFTYFYCILFVCYIEGLVGCFVFMADI